MPELTDGRSVGRGGAQRYGIGSQKPFGEPTLLDAYIHTVHSPFQSEISINPML